jgi:hypothetical protein
MSTDFARRLVRLATIFTRAARTRVVDYREMRGLCLRCPPKRARAVHPRAIDEAAGSLTRLAHSAKALWWIVRRHARRLFIMEAFRLLFERTWKRMLPVYAW